MNERAEETLFAVCVKCGNDRFSEDLVITTKGAAATFKTVLVCDQCREPLSDPPHTLDKDCWCQPTVLVVETPTLPAVASLSAPTETNTARRPNVGEAPSPTEEKD